MIGELKKLYRSLEHFGFTKESKIISELIKSSKWIGEESKEYPGVTVWKDDGKPDNSRINPDEKIGVRDIEYIKLSPKEVELYDDFANEIFGPEAIDPDTGKPVYNLNSEELCSYISNIATQEISNLFADADEEDFQRFYIEIWWDLINSKLYFKDKKFKKIIDFAMNHLDEFEFDIYEKRK